MKILSEFSVGMFTLFTWTSRWRLPIHVIWWLYMDECNIEISEKDTPQWPRTGLNQPGMQEDQIVLCSNASPEMYEMFLFWPDWGARDGEEEASSVLHRGRISAELKLPLINSKGICCVLEPKDSKDKWNSTPWRIKMKRRMNTSNFKNEWWQLELESFGSESVNRKCGSSGAACVKQKHVIRAEFESI